MSLLSAHRALGAGLLLLVATAAKAEPPPDADPALSPWFNSLRTPRGEGSCCSAADCRPVASRVRSGLYEALIGDDWVRVPWSRVLPRTDNPTGRAVACWHPAVGVMCFVRPPES